MFPRKVWMNGHNCLQCGKGWYEGYTPDRTLTQPCKECGHQAPERMLATEFKAAVDTRDKRIWANWTPPPIRSNRKLKV